MSDIVTKLAKVLNQAENAATPEEAEAFFKAAQAISTRYSIDLATARAHTAKKEQRENPVRRSVNLQDFGRNTKKHLVQLFNTISTANDVRIDIARSSSMVYPYGFPSDIELVETLFAHIAMQMVDEANRFLEKGEYKNETTVTYVRRKNYSTHGWHYERNTGRRYDWEEERVEKPVDGRVARSNFYSGFISRIGSRLQEAKREVTAEAVAESTGTELVLAEKMDEVNAHYKKTSNAKGSWNGPSMSGYSSGSRSAGSAAGARARIGGQGSIGNRGAIGA